MEHCAKGERVNAMSLIFCHTRRLVSTEVDGNMANLCVCVCFCVYVCVCVCECVYVHMCGANGGTNNGTYGWHGHAIFSLHTKDEVSYEQ